MINNSFANQFKCGIVNFNQELLRLISDQISEMLLKNPASREMLRKYALRQKGAEHFISAFKRQSTESNGSNAGDLSDCGQSTNEAEPGHDGLGYYAEIDPVAVSNEVFMFLVEFLERKDLSSTVADAACRSDIKQLQILLYQKCRSRFADGARNPRFRAIRTVLSDAGKAGTLTYKPGKQLYSGETGRETTEYGCFAFSVDENLPVLPASELDRESFGDWPYPQFIMEHDPNRDSSDSGIPFTQKQVILETARLFWNEISTRYEPCFVYISDLKRYMEMILPTWLIESLLPDPASPKMNVFISDLQGDPGSAYERASESRILDESTGIFSDPIEVEYDDAVNDGHRLAREWFAGLKPEWAQVFCFMYYCEFALTDAARRTGLKSPQSADYHYRSAQKNLASFCSRQGGLSLPDYDPDLARLFLSSLGEICEEDVLEEGC
jgi:hypothetical protein